MATTRTNAGVPVLKIEYAATEDLPNGEPWAPDGNEYWAVVARLRGRGITLWRHIGIATTREERVANDR